MAPSSVISPFCTCAIRMASGSRGVFFPKFFRFYCGQDRSFSVQPENPKSEFSSWETDARKLDKLSRKELRMLTKLSLSSRPTPTEGLASSTKNGLYEGTPHGKLSLLNLNFFLIVCLIPPTKYVALNVDKSDQVD